MIEIRAKLRVVRDEDQEAITEIRSEDAATALLTQIGLARTETQVREALAASLAASHRAAKRAARRRAAG